jgi:hypothetical protein
VTPKDRSEKIRKPVLVYLVGVGYSCAPLICVLQNRLADRPFDWHDILLMVLYPIVGYGLLRFRRWGWYLLLAHAAFLFVNNAVIGLLFGGVNRPILLQLNLLILFLVWYFLRRSVSSPFHDPALRWWERQNPRYGAVFTAVFRRPDATEGTGTGFNISAGGCFVCLEDDHGLAEGEAVDLELPPKRGEPFHSRARVAWLADGSGDNPRGAGLQFHRTDKANRQRLLDMLAEAKTEAKGSSHMAAVV